MASHTFSADKAAFFLFDDRPHKHTWRRLGIAYVLARLVLIALILVIAAPFVISTLPNLTGMDPQSDAFKTQLQGSIQIIQSVGYLGAILFLPIFAAIYTALLRWMIRGQSGGKWFGLRFGQDEINVLVVLIALFVVVLFAALLALIPLAVLIAIAVALKGGSLGGVFIALSILYALVWLAAVIWFSVRLSPAPALTVKHGKIQVFETLAISRGHFWGLFLAYVVQFFILLALSLGLVFAGLLVSLPFLGAGLALFGGDEPSMANVGAYIALAAVPLLFFALMGLAIEYLRYAMGAGVGACLVMAEDQDQTPAQRPDPEPASPRDDGQTSQSEA